MTQLQRGDLFRLNRQHRGQVAVASEKALGGCRVEDGLPVRRGILAKFAALYIDYEKETATELLTARAGHRRGGIAVIKTGSALRMRGRRLSQVLWHSFNGPLCFLASKRGIWP